MFGLSRGILSKLGYVDISHLFPVIASAAGNLNSEIAACTTILDSSLRCAAFRMTGRGAGLRMAMKRAWDFDGICSSLPERSNWVAVNMGRRWLRARISDS